jgi:dienelactone hydrolase
MTTALRSIDFWPEMPFLSYEIWRMLATAPQGGCDPGEVIWTAARIDPANRESWQAEWAAMAREVEGIAEQAGSERSKRDAYLRACQYWRHANFVMPFDDPRKQEYHRHHQRCFRTAMPWFDTKSEVAEIPYDGTYLDGYLIHPAGDVPQPWPVVIFGGTFDSTAEEKYFALGRLLAERGLAVLLYDGPGTGSSLLFRGTASRYDYEAPIGQTIDWIAGRPELDETRVALVGWGSGGYYTCRAAAFEPRLAAGVAWNVFYGDGADEGDSEPASFEEWKRDADSGKLGNPVFNRFAAELTAARLLNDPERAKQDKMDLTGILDKVTCPFLILVGGKDLLPFEGDSDESVSDSQRVYNELGSQDKTLAGFPSDGPGSRHVQVDGQERARAIMADWLVDRLASPA